SGEIRSATPPDQIDLTDGSRRSFLYRIELEFALKAESTFYCKGGRRSSVKNRQRASYGLEFINQTGKYREQQISRARKNWAVGRYLARNIASARSVMRGVCP
ncbi:hypothetical protein J6590_104281, partial [Homalodisca vitripennis]